MAGLSLDSEQLDRYSRHIILEEVGPEGQKALLDANVLVVGAGGLGAPVLQYLAAAGIGHIGIVDDDVVERSNLQRQVIHGDDDIGRPKAESAREFIDQLNPDIDVSTHEVRLSQENIHDFLTEYEFVVDCTDNFPTRYLINDACTLAGVPFSHGAILRFEGQVTTFEAGEESPCYRYLFPEAPPEDQVTSCATAGVLGVLPGTIGCIQATETAKHIIDHGTTLDGRLILYDAAEMTFDEVEVPKDPTCPVCSDGGIESVEEVEYEARCTI